MRIRRHFILISALLTIVSPVRGQKTLTVGDAFVGRYKKALGFSWDKNEGTFITLTKTNEVYYFNSPSWVLPFTNASQTQLRNQSMGTMTLGQMSFSDQTNEAIPVLRCEFCYESFLLIGEGLHGRRGRKDF
jgi:hypothetical protein